MTDKIVVADLLQEIWKRKVSVILVTIVVTLISSTYAYLVLRDTYEVNSLVRLSLNSDQKIDVEMYNSILKNDVTLERIFNKSSLENKVSPFSVKNNLVVELVGNNTIALKYKGQDPQLIADTLNAITSELSTSIGITNLSDSIVDMKARMTELDKLIDTSKSIVKSTEKLLQTIPATVPLTRVLAEDAYLSSVVKENNGGSAKEIGGIQYTAEVINPAHTEAQNKLTEEYMNLSKNQGEKTILQSNIDKDMQLIDQMENAKPDQLNTKEGEVWLEGKYPLFISPAVVPANPVAPNRLKISVLGLIAGIIVGASIASARVVFRKPNSV